MKRLSSLIAISILSSYSSVGQAEEASLSQVDNPCSISFSTAREFDAVGQYFKELMTDTSECQKGLRIVRESRVAFEQVKRINKIRQLLSKNAGLFKSSFVTPTSGPLLYNVNSFITTDVSVDVSETYIWVEHMKFESNDMIQLSRETMDAIRAAHNITSNVRFGVEARGNRSATFLFLESNELFVSINGKSPMLMSRLVPIQTAETPTRSAPDQEVLIRTLGSNDYALRFQAAKQLMTAGDSKAKEKAKDVLMNILVNVKIPFYALESAKILEPLADATSTDAWLFVFSKAYEYRFNGGDENSMFALACRALARIKSPDTVSVIGEKLAYSKSLDSDNIDEAVKALISIGGTESMLYLKVAAENYCGREQSLILSGLEQIGEKDNPLHKACDPDVGRGSHIFQP